LNVEEKSRSQRKREVQALTDLGARLTELAPEQLRHIELPPELREAIEAYRAITSRGARRRQLLFIGGLMRRVDSSGIEVALAAIDQGHARQVEWQHRIERWRDRLVEGNDATLEEIARRWPRIDRQQLRQLVRNARGAPEGPERTRAARALLRLLREGAAGDPNDLT
jgi:ribosome-associated protein